MSVFEREGLGRRVRAGLGISADLLVGTGKARAGVKRRA